VSARKLSIKGEIEGEGDLELAGRFEADPRSAPGRRGERAEVDAEITATTIGRRRQVRGNLNASDAWKSSAGCVDGEPEERQLSRRGRAL